MSKIRSVLSVTNALTAPPVPAGTIKAFAVIRPSRALSVEAFGCATPVGHTVSQPNGRDGTTVAFIEYPWAVAGTLHALPGTGKLRVLPPVMIGPSTVPFALCVSTTR